MSDLRERVIAAIKAKGPHAKASTIADAVMPLCMEEAAREAECVVAYGESQAVMRENIASAIRALTNPASFS